MIKNMNTDRNWLLKMVAEEDNTITSVGGLILDLSRVVDTDRSALNQLKSTNAFAKLIELSRRKRKLSADEFAQQANIDVKEIYDIECGNYSDIEPRTLHRLAAILGYNVRKLMVLSGQATPKDATLNDAAVRFAAQSGSDARDLSDEEQEALDEFVRSLVE